MCVRELRAALRPERSSTLRSSAGRSWKPCSPEEMPAIQLDGYQWVRVRVPGGAPDPGSYLFATHRRRLLLPLFGYRGQHRQAPYSKPTPLEHHDGPLAKVIVQPGKVRQQNSGLVVRPHGFVGAQQHE